MARRAARNSDGPEAGSKAIPTFDRGQASGSNIERGKELQGLVLRTKPRKGIKRFAGQAGRLARHVLEHACSAARYAGHPLAFLTAVLLVLIWALTGPLFAYSDTWQLVINTSTTIVTFLMVFLIQHTQNRDTLAVQLKLAELIMAANDAENRLATAEDLSEEELEELHKDFQRRAEELDRLKQHRARLKHAN